MIFILIIAALLLIWSLVIIEDLEKRITNTISYIEILKSQNKININSAKELKGVLRGE